MYFSAKNDEKHCSDKLDTLQQTPKEVIDIFGQQGGFNLGKQPVFVGYNFRFDGFEPVESTFQNQKTPRS